MKLKILSVFVLSVFILSACEAEGEEVSLSAIAPNGSPSLSQVPIEYDPSMVESMEYDMEVVAGADLLVSAFGSESHDLVFAPLNVGANLYQTGVPYQLAAVVSFGNLFFASAQSINSISDLDGEEIVVFGQNATPDIIVRSLIEQHSFEETPEIRYVDSVDAAGGTLQSEPQSIVLMAEPALSVQMSQIDSDIHLIDLQDEWQSAFDTDGYPQAGVFVHEDVDDDALNIYLGALRASIDMVNSDPSSVANDASALDYPFPAPIIESALPRSNVRFETAHEARASIESFFEEILALQADLIGGELPDDAFYRFTDFDDVE